MLKILGARHPGSNANLLAQDIAIILAHVLSNENLEDAAEGLFSTAAVLMVDTISAGHTKMGVTGDHATQDFENTKTKRLLLHQTLRIMLTNRGLNRSMH